MVDMLGNVHEYSVSELAGAVKKSIEDGFGFVRVRGELGRVTTAGSGHVYLDLKDDKAVLSSVIWKGSAERLRFAPEQGMEVVATGKLTTFPGQSRYQLVIDSLEPAGLGALMALFEERKKKLAVEGLFAAERKRQIPFLPDVIGVVTSPSGAVIRDILHRLRDRFPRHVLVWPTLVQGKGAELKIAAAIDGFNALPKDGPVPRPDVLIVARGGGSLEDLWCFNEEAVVRAVAASRIPLISAVGHETDTTLIDFASDRRAPTPSAAAEFAVPKLSDLLAELLSKEGRMLRCMTKTAEHRRAALLSAARALGKPEDVLGAHAQRLDRASDLLPRCLNARLHDRRRELLVLGGRLGKPVLLAGLRERGWRLHRSDDRLCAGARRAIEKGRRDLREQRAPRGVLIRLYTDKKRAAGEAATRLSSACGRSVGDRRARLDAAAKLLQSVSHQSVLQRGFALVKSSDGALVARASDAKPGAAVALVFADGQRGARIDPAPEGRGAGGGPTESGSTGAKPKPRGPAGPAPQKSLFD